MENTYELKTDAVCPRCNKTSVMSGKDGYIYRYVCITDFCNWELEIDTEEYYTLRGNA